MIDRIEDMGKHFGLLTKTKLMVIGRQPMIDAALMPRSTNDGTAMKKLN